jgi:cell division protein FtsW (lipid II flippase)
MSRSVLTMLGALCVAPAVAFLVYRLARGLGFLESPVDPQHALRREIVVALYAFLIFLPVLFYGYEKAWPRAWVIFGIFNGLAMLFFVVFGGRAALRLGRLRHPGPAAPTREPTPGDEPSRSL